MKTMKLVVSIVDENGVELSKEEVPITSGDISLVLDGDPAISTELFNPVYEACEKAKI